MVALSARFMWSSLGRPWVFVGLALVALYCVSAYLFLRQFSGIGITGVVGTNPQTPFQMLRREALLSLAVFAVASVAILWGLRQALVWVR